MGFGPKIPEWVNRVNFITNYFWEGCEAPFRLFCEFAQAPSGQAIALLIGLDIDDVVKTFWRPAGLRSHRHGRKGPRGRKGLPDLPDVNDEIGKRIPGQAEFAGRPFGSPTRWVFEISDVADRVAFNIAIIDVVSDTVYKALLGIIEVDQDKCWWMKRGKANGDIEAWIHSRDDWLALSMPFPVYEKGVDMLFAGTQLPGDGSYFMTLEQTLHQYGPDTTTTQIGIWDDTAGEFLGTSGGEELSPGDGTVLTCSGVAPGGHTIIWQMKNRGGHVSRFNSTATVLQMSR